MRYGQVLKSKDVEGETTSSSKVESTELEEPSIWIPCSTCNGIIYDRRPDEDKKQRRTKSTSLHRTADSELSSGTREYESIQVEKNVGDPSTSCTRGSQWPKFWRFPINPLAVCE